MFNRLYSQGNYMGKSSISKQAESYAEVIVGQIAGNFRDLDFAIKNCPDLKNAQKEYDEANKDNLEPLKLKELQDNIDILKDSIGSGLCDDKYSTIEPLAVGLFGEWGSGKTHQLKLIKQRIIREQNEDKSREDIKKIFPKRTIPIFFNAWRFEKEEHIILPLFETLLKDVEAFERPLDEKAKVIVNELTTKLKVGALSLHKGLKAPDSFKSVAVDALSGNYGGALMRFFDTGKFTEELTEKTNEELVGDQKIGEMLNPEKLESIYLNITQWIKYITLTENVNFVFLIDDLDRCLPENTLKMLESIKLFLDVPSCAFVLAVDDDVVERGVVHHYRDYLSIYHHKDTEDAKGVLQHELPITGHEYLEKMIQLPIRLPVIDEVNAKEFLISHSQKWIDIVDKRDEERRKEDHAGKVKTIPKESEKLLAFFAEYIPPKPRKLIRTAKLFETKLLLLGDLCAKVDLFFVAKLTLLELFAPELLRFIQNNGYGLVFNSLCHFREASYQFHRDRELQYELQGKQPSEPIERFYNSLLDLSVIRQYIDTPPGFDSSYTIKEKTLFHKAIRIIEKYEANRITFDLDTVFEKSYDTEKLKLIMEMQEPKDKEELSSRKEVFTNEFMIRLFRDGDVDAWKDALAEHEAVHSTEQVTVLVEKAKEEKDKTFNDLPFIANPEWVGVVAKYVSDDYITLLKASHDARFVADERLGFEIDMFTITFSEYDKYCEIANKDKPKDEGWGRGRRPVINVNWNDATSYIKWLNKKIGDKYIYGLPTRKQWEIACKESVFKKPLSHFGDVASKLKEYVWDVNNSKDQTHRVGELKSNELGLYDMYGNIWEWTSSDSDIQKEAKVLLGGGHSTSTEDILTEMQVDFDKKSFYDDTGFRLLRILH